MKEPSGQVGKPGVPQPAVAPDVGPAHASPAAYAEWEHVLRVALCGDGTGYREP